MAKTVKPANLGAAIAKELTLYHKEAIEGINEAGEKAVKDLVKKTKATAPKRTGDFRRRITWSALPGVSGLKQFVWHVKAPDHRLTHLLVNGHPKKNGGRVAGDPFLENAMEQVLPDYETAVEEALKND